MKNLDYKMCKPTAKKIQPSWQQLLNHKETQLYY